MTASAGSGMGPAVSHCEPSGVRDGVLSTHPQNESRLDLLSHVWEWLRHGVLKNVSRFCRRGEAHRYLHSIRCFLLVHSHISKAIPLLVCMHAISLVGVCTCMYIHTEYCCMH